MNAQSPNDEILSNRMRKGAAVGRARFVNSWIIAHSHVAAAEDHRQKCRGRRPHSIIWATLPHLISYRDKLFGGRTLKNTSIHMLKTFLISKLLLLPRGVASGGIGEFEVAGVEGVRIWNTDKCALVRVCACIFWGAIKKAPSTKLQHPEKFQASSSNAEGTGLVSSGFVRFRSVGGGSHWSMGAIFRLLLSGNGLYSWLL
jgi:hypothetical protein